MGSSGKREKNKHGHRFSAPAVRFMFPRQVDASARALHSLSDEYNDVKCSVCARVEEDHGGFKEEQLPVLQRMVDVLNKFGESGECDKLEREGGSKLVLAKLLSL